MTLSVPSSSMYSTEYKKYPSGQIFRLLLLNNDDDETTAGRMSGIPVVVVVPNFGKFESTKLGSQEAMIVISF